MVTPEKGSWYWCEGIWEPVFYNGFQYWPAGDCNFPIEDDLEFRLGIICRIPFAEELIDAKI